MTNREGEKTMKEDDSDAGSPSKEKEALPLTPRDVEKARLAALPSFDNKFPELPGVLLSDKIERYCEEDCCLITPFLQSNLRPAGYDLRVGANYAIKGQNLPLVEGYSFKIEPYTVAVIETLETLNLPKFLIGRWNIRVTLAYKGLLWVGGAQVDPGFRGKLSCPIYNLSTEAVQLNYGDALAMIDFVTTTPFTDESRAFDWEGRKKVVFAEYSTGLTSGVEQRLDSMQEKILENEEKQRLSGEALEERITGDLEQNANKTETRLNYVNTRFDTFLTLIFTIVAILFAGLGVIATKGSNDPSFFTSPVVLATVALYLSFRAYANSERERENSSTIPSATSKSIKDVFVKHPLEIALCLFLAVGDVFAHYYQSRVTWNDLRQSENASQLQLKADAEENARLKGEIDAFQKKTAEELQRLRTEIESERGSSSRAQRSSKP
jgi:dCTP deaminase